MGWLVTGSGIAVLRRDPRLASRSGDESRDHQGDKGHSQGEGGPSKQVNGAE